MKMPMHGRMCVLIYAHIHCMFLLFAFHEYMVLLFVLAKPLELVFYNQQLKKSPF